MREVKAIIGLVSKTGVPIMVSDFETRLATAFEGATINYGRGLWQGIFEPNVTITVACDGEEAERALDTLVNLARAMGQEAVYVMDAQGHISIKGL